MEDIFAKEIDVGDGCTVMARKKGIIMLKSTSTKRRRKHIERLMPTQGTFLPDMDHISCSALLKAGNTVLFGHMGCSAPKHGYLFFSCRVKDGLYPVETILNQRSRAYAATAN